MSGGTIYFEVFGPGDNNMGDKNDCDGPHLLPLPQAKDRLEELTELFKRLTTWLKDDALSALI